jgi:hypothetical protein
MTISSRPISTFWGIHSFAFAKERMGDSIIHKYWFKSSNLRAFMARHTMKSARAIVLQNLPPTTVIIRIIREVEVCASRHTIKGFRDTDSSG